MDAKEPPTPWFSRWFNPLVEQGWPKVLPPSELALLLAIARHASIMTLRAYPFPKRLREMTRLPRTSFYRAQGNLVSKGLLRIEQEKGRRIYILASPPPAEHTPRIGARKSHRREPAVPPMGVSNRQSPRQSRRSAQKTSVFNTRVKEVFRLAVGRLGQFAVEELARSELGQIVSAANAVALEPERLEEVSRALSRTLQAAGIQTWETQVRAALQNIVAALAEKSADRPADGNGRKEDALIQKAVELFGATVVEVRPR